jgi:cytochrome P450
MATLNVPTTEGIGSLESTNNILPTEYYDRLRERGEVVRDEERGVWLVTSYDAVKELSLQDQKSWQHPSVYDPMHPPFGLGEDEWVEFIGGKWALQLHEGATHDRMHRWWMRVFSPKVLAEWGRALIDPAIHRALDALADRGRAELCDELCEQITSRAMTAVMGLPYDDDEWRERFARTTKERTALFQFQGNASSASDDSVARSLEAGRELGEMILPFVEAERPGTEHEAAENSFIAMLWSAGDDLWGGEEFDARDVMAHAKNAFTAAVDSAATTAGNGFYLLATQPALQREILKEEKACANFVEETLRLYSQVEFRPRWAKHDVKLCGAQIKQGEMAIALTACANRDPRRYSHPEEVDLARKAPRDHFGFFQGPRLCVGQGLARFMLERIYTIAAERLVDLQLDPDAPPPAYSGGMLRKWQPLNAVFAVN